MAILALPLTGSFRCLEAIHGFTPPAPKKSMRNFVMYFSCVFGLQFDPIKLEPKRSSLKFLKQQLKKLGWEFILVSLLLSVLSAHDYSFFETEFDASSAILSPMQMFSWKHLANNYLVAMGLSWSLSQSSRGVSILYNLAYGCETYEVVKSPMFKSSSPSDFWGKRWNILVHRGLKNGVYKPVRKRLSSSYLAVLAVFIVSGILHEYVNLVIFTHPEMGFPWKQIVFFGWNGILILLEYAMGEWALFQWMQANLPRICISTLVIGSALPLSHLFTGEYIKGGYFKAVEMAEPLIICGARTTF